MESVLVLLSTYNGEKFLRDQLDSLFSQSGIKLHLLVRDDGSSDNTLAILDDYSKRFENITIIKGANVGVGASFMALVYEAASNYFDYDYFAFSDQDDVWFKNKLLTGVNALNDCSNELKMFFSGAINTDSSLIPISTTCVRNVNSFGANLVANHILGCTMLFNAPLLQAINKINTMPYTIPSGKIPIHDAWTAFVAYSLGAAVIQSNTGMMYYRQHGSNVIGSGHGFWSIQKNRIRRYLLGTTHYKANKCIIALQVFGDEIPMENRRLLELVAQYRNSTKSKIRLIFDKRMYEYGFLDNIGTFITILFNKF